MSGNSASDWGSALGSAFYGPIGGMVGSFIGSKIDGQNDGPTRPRARPSSTENSVSASTFVNAAASYLSSKQQAKNQQSLANQGTDLGKLRREAEANGFNPLTVLRATGGQGFRQDVSMGSGALASASFFNAFAGLGQNIAQAKQQEATLKNTIASTANYASQTRNLSSSAFGQLGPNGVDPTRTKIEVAGVASTPANMTDAEVAEQRWGDFGGSVYGLIVLLGDAISSSAAGMQSVYEKTPNKPQGAWGPNRAELLKESFRLSRPILQTTLD